MLPVGELEAVRATRVCIDWQHSRLAAAPQALQVVCCSSVSREKEKALARWIDTSGRATLAHVSQVHCSRQR